MKNIEKLLSRIYILLIIGIGAINMFCENQIIRHIAVIVYLVIILVLSTWYVLTRKPIKKIDKFGLIGVYTIAAFGFIYVFTKNYR